ncbi:MAG: helix-turn-helix domain-containing protein [Solirubrobacteraceae bacterium]
MLRPRPVRNVVPNPFVERARRDIQPLTIRLDPDQLAELERGLAARLASVTTTQRWLDLNEAASYIRAPTSRIRKLVMTREIPHHRDGRRLLFRRDELDEFIRNGGAFTP